MPSRMRDWPLQFSTTATVLGRVRMDKAVDPGHSTGTPIHGRQQRPRGLGQLQGRSSRAGGTRPWPRLTTPVCTQPCPRSVRPGQHGAGRGDGLVWAAPAWPPYTLHTDAIETAMAVSWITMHTQP